MTQEEFCDEFMLVDLRDKDNCLKATKDCADVYNLAADMGGMGFIQVRLGMRLRDVMRDGDRERCFCDACFRHGQLWFLGSIPG